MIKKIIITLASLSLLACSNTQVTLEGVTPPAKEVKGDGYVFLEFLEHKDSSFYLKPLPDDRVEIIFRGRKDDIEKVYLYFNDDEYEMESMGSIGGVEYFSADAEGEGKYYFKIEDGNFTYYYGQEGSYTKEGIKEYEYKRNTALDTDQSLMGRIWYQIYIDAFNNGTEDNDPLFNEFGPESYTKPKGWLTDGTPLEDLADGWGDRRKKNNLGSFGINSWTGDFNKELLWEKKANKLYSWSGKATKRFGGDIQGIEEKLDYISQLGVGGVWLSPVTYSYSGNKYDAIDYRHISPDFGSIKASTGRYGSEYKLLATDSNGINKLGEGLGKDTWKLTQSDQIFEDFIKKLKEKDMKLMVELNFDYVSNKFFAFEALLMKGPESKYLDWFFIDSWKDIAGKEMDEWNPLLPYEGNSPIDIVYREGKRYRRAFVEVKEDYTEKEKIELINWNRSNLEYEGYKGNKAVVRLNLGNKEVKKYLYDSTEKFVKMGIDAYSIGYSEENKEFYEGYKSYLENKYDGFKVVYHINANEKVEDRRSARISYEVGDVLYRYLMGKDSNHSYDNRETEVAVNILKKSGESDIVFNMLDSFDTDRFSSMLLNKDRDYDMFNKQDRNGYLGIRPDLLDESIKKKTKLAAIAQYTLPGVPVIYYGDEKSMWGGDLPYNRKPMLWEEKFPYDKESDGLDKYENYKGPLTESAVFDEVTKKIRYNILIDTEMEKFYKKLNEIYTEYLDLFSKGKFSIIPNESKLAVYKRSYNERDMIVALNNTEKTITIEQEVESGKIYINPLTGEEVEVIADKVELKVEGYSGLILIEKIG